LLLLIVVVAMNRLASSESGDTPGFRSLIGRARRAAPEQWLLISDGAVAHLPGTGPRTDRHQGAAVGPSAHRSDVRLRAAVCRGSLEDAWPERQMPGPVRHTAGSSSRPYLPNQLSVHGPVSLLVTQSDRLSASLIPAASSGLRLATSADTGSATGSPESVRFDMTSCQAARAAPNGGRTGRGGGGASLCGGSAASCATVASGYALCGAGSASSA